MVEGSDVVHSVGVVGLVVVVGFLLWGLKGAVDVSCSVTDAPLLEKCVHVISMVKDWYQDQVTTLCSAMLSSVCGVHGAAVDAGVEEAVVITAVVIGGEGEEVVIVIGVVTAEVGINHG